ncbi:hypothetical protein GCM10010266_46620 [Streptomyces griseomycini]|nr:hypothetical protein GCM10010266_46620 [Streptomyces griseomycini]
MPDLGEFVEDADVGVEPANRAAGVLVSGQDRRTGTSQELPHFIEELLLLRVQLVDLVGRVAGQARQQRRREQQRAQGWAVPTIGSPGAVTVS